MKERGCASPEHSPGCPCPRCSRPQESCSDCKELTIQHVVPQCIGRKILRISDKKIREYTQMESRACHRANDPKVPQVFEQMKKLKKQGDIFTISDVLRMREKNTFKTGIIKL